MNKIIQYLLLVPAVLLLAACGSKSELNTKVSNTTGWNYYDEATTNFQAQEGVGNLTAPGMVPIQGGTFTLGEKDVHKSRHAGFSGCRAFGQALLAAERRAKRHKALADLVARRAENTDIQYPISSSFFR